jgi:CopG family nickel-responsive transcriptional regulator
VQEQCKARSEDGWGTITIAYSQQTRELSNALTHLQHRDYKLIVCATHIHLDDHNCPEVLIVREKGEEIKKIRDRLIAPKGIKHGKLSLTTTGKQMG